MARFPTREAEIRALAQSIAAGLADAQLDFPNPPMTPVQLQTLITTLGAKNDAQVAAAAAAQEATDAKRAALDDLIAAMKSILRYAEDAVRCDDTKLAKLGWGSKAGPTALQPPGQPRSLEAPRQGEGWIFLDWKPPADGGAVTAYQIERRERPAGDWALASMAIPSEITLTGQDRGKDWEYRVIATNKAGASLPSNVVAATL